MRGFSRCIPRSTVPSAPTFKRTNISPVTILAARNNRVWYSVRVIPLSVEKTALVYDVYCKPGRIPGEEIVALRERSRDAVQAFEARWRSGDKSGYVLRFFLFSFFFLSLSLSLGPTPRVPAPGQLGILPSGQGYSRLSVKEEEKNRCSNAASATL